MTLIEAAHRQPYVSHAAAKGMSSSAAPAAMRVLRKTYARVRRVLKAIVARDPRVGSRSLADLEHAAVP